MFYNAILEKALLPFGDKLVGTSLMKKLEEWRKLSQYDENHLFLLQEQRLNDLLSFAAEYIPFYKKNAHGSITKGNDLTKFPVLEKMMLKEFHQQLLYPNEKKFIRLFTSGSSGIQSTTYANKNDISNFRAIQTLNMMRIICFYCKSKD